MHYTVEKFQIRKTTPSSRAHRGCGGEKCKHWIVESQVVFAKDWITIFLNALKRPFKKSKNKHCYLIFTRKGIFLSAVFYESSSRRVSTVFMVCFHKLRHYMGGILLKGTEFGFVCTWRRTECCPTGDPTSQLKHSKQPVSDVRQHNQPKQKHRRLNVQTLTQFPGSFSQDMKELRFPKLQHFPALWWN